MRSTSPIAKEDQRVGMKGFEAVPAAPEQPESPVEAVPRPDPLGSAQKSIPAVAPGSALPKPPQFPVLPNEERTRHPENISLSHRSRNDVVRPNTDNPKLEPSTDSAPIKTVQHFVDRRTTVSATTELSDKGSVDHPKATTERKFVDADSSTPKGIPTTKDQPTEKHLLVLQPLLRSTP